MGPYSHVTLAVKLEPHLHPENIMEYYWGSIIPDIRYLAQIPREQTHFGQERLMQLIVRYPHLKSFLLGYRVHCILDQVDVFQIVSKAFPFNVLKHMFRMNFSQQQITMLVEIFYLQTAIIFKKMAGNHNEVLNDLGITPEQTRMYYRAMQEYFDSHSFEVAISAFQRIKMIENADFEKYQNAYRLMKNRKVMNSILMFSIKNARLDYYVMNLYSLKSLYKR
jgi:hypothetical protein